MNERMIHRDLCRWLVALALAVTFIPVAASADPPEKKVVIKYDHDDDDDDDRKRVVTRTHIVRQYVPTRREYAHVRLTRFPRVDDHIDHRTIVVRSARVQPYVIERFEPRTRENLNLVIRHFKEGRPTEALPVWTSFCNGSA